MNSTIYMNSIVYMNSAVYVNSNFTTASEQCHEQCQWLVNSSVNSKTLVNSVMNSKPASEQCRE